ncbi:MFS transporter, partial [Streptomyces inhibens]
RRRPPGWSRAPGPAPYALPWAAAGVVAVGLALHLAVGRRSRVAAGVSTLGCYEHS